MECISSAIEKLKQNIPWTPFTEIFKKRVVKYFLHRYLGRFLENFSLDQLTIDLTKGTGTIKNLYLDNESMNDVATQLNLPFKFLNGFIEEIRVSIPWRNILHENSFVEITGLNIVIHPNKRNGDISLVDSMIDSMTSSIQIAQECLSQVDNADYFDEVDSNNSRKTNSIDAIETFSKAIDTILYKVKVLFTDTVVQVKYIPESSTTGIALHVKIKNIDYFDEAGRNESEAQGKNTFIEGSSFASKKFLINGVDFYTQLFKTKCENFASPSNESESTEINDNNFKVTENSILIAKLKNHQEIKLKLRKSENVSGPKMHIESNIGDLILYATPRQVHLLFELVNSFSNPVSCSTNTSIRKKVAQKPMNLNDFCKVEKELNKYISPQNLQIQALNNQFGWSCPPENDQDTFLPFDKSLRSNFYHNNANELFDLESSYTSTTSATIDERMFTEISNIYEVGIRSIVIVILHEDILNLSNDDLMLTSTKELQNTSSSFFNSMADVNSFESDGCHDNYIKLVKKLKDVESRSHLRFIGTNITLGANEKYLIDKHVIDLNISINWGELVENINNGTEKKSECYEILKFKENSKKEHNMTPFYNHILNPKIKCSINCSYNTLQKQKLFQQCESKYDIDVILEDCDIKVDASIIDRINTILNNSDIIKKSNIKLSSEETPPSLLDNTAVFENVILDAAEPVVNINVSIKCPLLSSKLFFPIPDFRPLSDMERVPWWQRNVRDDILIINLQDFFSKFHLSGSATTTYELLCSKIEVLFQEQVDICPITVLKAEQDNSVEEGFDFIRMFVKSFPPKLYSELESSPVKVNEYNVMTKSTMGFLAEVNEKSSNLFSRRKIASQQSYSIDEISIPSNLSEVNQFIDETFKDIKYDVEIFLSNLKILLPSKRVSEIIYNRVVSDILLWTPSAPKNCYISNCNSTNSKFSQTFKPFTSYKNNCFDNENIFDDENGAETSARSQYDNDRDKQTFMGLKITISSGVAIIHTPYRDFENNLCSDNYGEVVLTLDNGFIFLASGYKGDRNSSLGYISSKFFEIFHNPKNIRVAFDFDKEFNFLGKKLNPVLYPSENVYKMSGGPKVIDKKDRLSLCFKINSNDVRKESNIKLTGNVFGLTLRYFTLVSNQSWFSQISEFANVEDYPVQGFSWPDAMTELSLHFENCGIDYQPLNLLIKSYICIDSLAVLCNLTIQGSASVIYFIIEDAGLFLSENTSSSHINIMDNFVCVMDLGVFEVCIKLDKESVAKAMTYSSNTLNIRTCSDSFKALMELFTYLANEGDLVSEPMITSTVEKNLAEKLSEKLKVNEDKTLIDYHEMLQEAMIESQTHYLPKSETSKAKNEESDIFLFPDEASHPRKVSECSVDTASSFNVEFALNEASLEEPVYSSSVESKGTDDEYCILDDIPGTGIRSPSGKPEAKRLFQDTIKIDNHYFDLSSHESLNSNLSTPKHFPKAEIQYNLQEISIMWSMYGGCDFKTSRNVTFSSTVSDDSMHFNCTNKTKFKAVSFFDGETKFLPEKAAQHGTSSRPAISRKWYVNGGRQRDHDTLVEICLNKVRFNNELFPKETKYVSHKVFKINDIEFRDRLLSSQINKFLYQYCSESLPKQASSNMIEIKAVTKRNGPASPETNLSISCRPIRLNIDQDTLLFMCNFIEAIIYSEKAVEFAEEEKPVWTPDDLTSAKTHTNEIIDSEESEVSDVYFSNIIFSPEVPIKIDYHGKHVYMSSEYGLFAALIIGLGQLNHSEIVLKRVKMRGVLGINKLKDLLFSEWSNDIKRNQLPSVLGGVGPMHSFLKLFQGVKDLFWMPIEQYNKDGRVLRGIQKGSAAFTTSSAHAVLDLTNRFVGCVQSTAETLYDVVSSGPSVKKKHNRNRKAQPKDVREGVTTAIGIVKDGLGDTATAIIKAASEEHSYKGVVGAVGGVLRQIPPSVFQPIILASEATCTVIGGMTNQLVPDARREAVDKWKV